jgi:UMF1 family MFS transporter
MAGISARKRIWGWFFFDWASQPYHTLLLTFVFGPFFAGVAAQYFAGTGLETEAAAAKAQSVWSLCLTVTGLLIGFGAPLMGAIADTAGRRVPWVLGFSVLYIIGSTALWWTDPAGTNMWWMLIAFGIGFIGAEYALIFTNAQLPGLGTKEEIGNISGSGFAFGYVGGLIGLAIMLVFFMEQAGGKTLVGLDPAFGFDPAQREGTRFVGPFTALWYVVFMIPYFLWVREDPSLRKAYSFSAAIASLKSSIAGLRHNKSLTSYLGSSMLYRDSLNGLYGFGGVYAKLVLNWEIVQIGVFGIISGLSAAIFSWIGGKADRRFGPKPVIVAAIWVLILVVTTIVFMTREQIYGIPLPEGSNIPDIVFLICGMLIGGMGGILQASSRSLMVRHTTPENATESFGLYGLSGRATAFVAPFLIGVVTALTGSARLGVSPLIPLFLAGLLLLKWVKPEGEVVK